MIGKLDQRIIIQERDGAGTVDAEGQSTETWSTLATVWANVRMMNGMEERAYSRIVATSRRMFEMRYRNDVTVRMQLVWNSSSWNIHDIQSHPRDPYMLLACSLME